MWNINENPELQNHVKRAEWCLTRFIDWWNWLISLLSLERLKIGEGGYKCFHLMTGESVSTRSDGVIDPWLVSFWDKVFALYPSLADVIPMREDEP